MEFFLVFWGLGFIFFLGIGVGGIFLFVDIIKYFVIGGLGLGEVFFYKGGNCFFFFIFKLNVLLCLLIEVLRFICMRWIVI